MYKRPRKVFGGLFVAGRFIDVDGTASTISINELIKTGTSENSITCVVVCC